MTPLIAFILTSIYCRLHLRHGITKRRIKTRPSICSTASLGGYLEKAIPKEEDKSTEGRFRKYWLYNDGNAPMYKVSSYNRYRKILDNILLYAASSRLNSILRTGEMGFDWGKKHDGIFFKKDEEEKVVNLYDAAREEAERYIIR